MIALPHVEARQAVPTGCPVQDKTPQGTAIKGWARGQTVTVGIGNVPTAVLDPQGNPTGVNPREVLDQVLREVQEQLADTTGVTFNSSAGPGAYNMLFQVGPAFFEGKPAHGSSNSQVQASGPNQGHVGFAEITIDVLGQGRTTAQQTTPANLKIIDPFAAEYVSALRKSFFHEIGHTFGLDEVTATQDRRSAMGPLKVPNDAGSGGHLPNGFSPCDKAALRLWYKQPDPPGYPPGDYKQDPEEPAECSLTDEWWAWQYYQDTGICQEYCSGQIGDEYDACLDATALQICDAILFGECAAANSGGSIAPMGFGVTFRASNFQYLIVDGAGVITASQWWPGGEGTYTLVDQNGGFLEDGDAVALWAFNGRFVQAQDGGGDNKTIAAVGRGMGPWENFTIINFSAPGQRLQAEHAVGLVSDAGRFLSAVGGGGGSIHASATTVGAWEVFYINFDAGEAGGLCGDGVPQAGEACDAGTLNGACPAACSSSCTPNSCSGGPECGDGEFEPWHGEECDDGVANGYCPSACSSSCTLNPCAGNTFQTDDAVNLQVYNQQYVVADNGGWGYIYADRSVAQTWERFAFVDFNGGDVVDGDSIAFRTYGGAYLQARDGGGADMVGWGAVLGDWERFVVINIDNPSGPVRVGDRISLYSHNGYFAVAENGGGAVVNVNRTVIGEWEMFRVWRAQ